MRLCYDCFEEYDEKLDMCPHCGYEEDDAEEETVHLKPGKMLKEKYIIGNVIGYGGFGVTYLGWDTSLEIKVAIKEYLPSEFSTRAQGQDNITIFNGDKTQQFYDGVEKFVDEANKVAKFRDTDGIVRIYESFKENNTAYIVMEYLDGQTLTKYMNEVGLISAEETIRLMAPVMQSLQVVNEQGIIHRDIAPDNIMVTKDGRVKLIDFGAARFATTTHSRSLTVVVKAGYSPEEQYRSRGDQGPWTDVYALGATMYRMITGVVPPDAMERRAFFEGKGKDILVPLSKYSKDINENQETAILNAMNVRIEDRTADMAEFEEELNSEEKVMRKKGKIGIIDVLKWPLWAKITVPSVASIVILLSVLFITGVIGFNANEKRKFELPDGMSQVPSVISNDVYKAEMRLTDSVLLVSIVDKKYSDEIPANLIYSQSRSAGSIVQNNTVIEVEVSAGPEPTVEEIIKKNENDELSLVDVQYRKKDEGIELLELQKMVARIVEEASETVAAGVIISQDPVAGTLVKEGTEVTIVVSTGSTAFDMPDVVGQTEVNAKLELLGKGLSVQVEYAKDDNATEGTVIKQSTLSGEKVNRGDAITITICSGKNLVEVPNVVGKQKDVSETQLKELGLKVITSEAISDKPKGEVIVQIPEAGISLEPEGTVAITVSKGQCEITFDAQKGKVSLSSVTVNVGDMAMNLPTPTRDDYSFVGWFTSTDGGSQVTIYSTIEKDTKLYAHWTQDIYTVKYNANGGIVSPESEDVPSGSALVLQQPSRLYYTFMGWFTSEKGDEEVPSGTVVKGKMTLYAQWERTKYKVIYNANGGAVETGSKEVDAGTKIGDLVTPTREHYTFDGWYTAPDAGMKVSSSTMVTANMTLYAKWTKIVYKVGYDANGGTVATASVDVESGNKLGSVPTPTREYYTFNGWYTQSSGGSKVDSSTVIIGNQTVYAQWTPNICTITYDGNGSTGGSTASSSHTYGTNKSLTANGFTRTGYTFSGWTTNKDGSGTSYSNSQSVSNLTPVNEGIVTLYAKWTANTYTIQYNGNGNTSGSTASSSHIYDAAKALTSNGFSKTGYTFSGWSTSTTGTVVYSNTQSISNLTSTKGGSVTLYAKWTANTYTIKYDGNGNTDGSTASSSSKYDATITLTTNGFKKDYNDFKGWSTSKNGSVVYKDKASVKNLVTSNGGTITLYAIWEPKAINTSWVTITEAQNVGGQIVNYKWMYTKTTKTYGSWVAKTGSSIPTSNALEIRNSSYVEATYKTQYKYSRYADNDNYHIGPYANTWSGVYCGNYKETGWLDSPLTYKGYYYGESWWDSKNTYWWNQETRQLLLTDAYYKWEQCPITYPETTGETSVTTSHIAFPLIKTETIEYSNQKEYVQYRPK